MSRTTYLRYELLRTFRKRRFLLFSLGFPLLMFLLIAGANKSKTLDGISFPLYYMTGMVSWGSMIAIISSGTRISAERQVGWARQLRITPLRTSAYFRSKIICGYVMALLTIVVLFIAGSTLDVHLEAGEWATMTLLLLVGLVPFAVLGIMLGHVLKPDTLGPAVGGVTTLFALFGGSWGPLFTGRTFVDIVKCIPSYWLVQSGKVALGGSGWPPVEAWVVLGAWTLVLARLAVLAYRHDTARLV
jgi:ABC-2 type transport system permease protein